MAPPARRLNVLARQLVSCNVPKELAPLRCIGEDGRRVADPEKVAYVREPLRVVFQDESAAHDRYGGPGTVVVLEGELLRPRYDRDSNGGTVLLLMHPGGVLSSLPIVGALARAGLHVCAMASRYGNNDSTLVVEKVCVDLGAAVRHLKQTLGYAKVVLCGWSGGGGLTATYQGLAEQPPASDACTTPAGDIVKLQGLPPADGLVLMAAHAGRGRILSEWIDPAVTDEANPGVNRDTTVDIYSAAAPKAPFSPDFIARYRAAQAARIRRITAWAKQRLHELEAEASMGTSGWSRGLRDVGFVVHCTQADLARLDASIDPSDRAIEALDALAEENHSPVGLARFTTLRSWLSQWSLDDSLADAVRALRNVSVPVLLVVNGADALVPPAHASDMFAAVTHERKHLHTIKEASHYYFGQPAAMAEAVHTCHTWLQKEGLLEVRRSSSD